MRSTELQVILKEKGPLLGSELAAEAVAKGVSPNEVAARQAISRASLLSTDPVRFPHSFLYYLPDHRGAEYAKAVRRHLDTRPGYSRVFKLLLANRGWATWGQIAKAGCFAPNSMEPYRKRTETVQEALANFIALQLLQPDDSESHIYRIGHIFGQPRVSRSRFIKTLEQEQLLFEQFVVWLRENNFVPWTSHRVRPSARKAEDYNSTFWDVVGQLYLGPHNSAEKRAFLVADVLTSRTFSESDVDSVCDRLAVLSNRRLEGRRPVFFPFTLAAAYSGMAFSRLKEAGAVPMTLRSVLGQDAEEVLRALAGIELAWATNESINVGSVEHVLSKASHINALRGLMDNIRGELFSTLVALAWASHGYAVERERPLRDNEGNRSLPIDVVATRTGTTVMIECKGRQEGGIDYKFDLETLFQDRCKAAAATWTNNNAPVPNKAIYITTGTLHEDAQPYSNNTTKSHGISCEVWTKGRLVEFAKASGQDHIAQVVSRYY